MEARRTSHVPDPLSMRMRHSIEPFGWDEVPREHPDVLAFFAQAAEHGLHDGVCLPVRCNGTEVVAVTLAGASPPAIGTARTGHFQQIWSYSLNMIARVRDLLACLDLLRGSEHLTARQRQVVTLVAEGQKFEDIAQLLGAHRRTVEGTFYACLEKFGVGSREALLVRAYAAGQITPRVTQEIIHLHQTPWRER